MTSTFNSVTTEQKQQYIANGGTRCPSCGSEDIVGEDISVEEGIATQEMSCNICDLEWSDVYHLTSITDRQ